MSCSMASMSASRRALEYRARQLEKEAERLAADASFLVDCLIRGGSYEDMAASIGRRSIQVAMETARLRGMRDVIELTEEA